MFNFYAEFPKTSKLGLKFEKITIQPNDGYRK